MITRVFAHGHCPHASTVKGAQGAGSNASTVTARQFIGPGSNASRSLPAMAPKRKDADQLGSVRQRAPPKLARRDVWHVWRVHVKLDGVTHGGPTRTSREEADEDMRAMRALPRSEMASFLRKAHGDVAASVPA